MEKVIGTSLQPYPNNLLLKYKGMRKVLPILVIGFVVVILILLFVMRFSVSSTNEKTTAMSVASTIASKISNIITPVSENNPTSKLKLVSQVEGVELELNNEGVLNQILAEQGVTSDVMIILTPVKQPKLPTSWKDDAGNTSTSISGDYGIDEASLTLTILIYIAPGENGLSNTDFRDSAFNYQLINMLVSTNPNKNLQDGESIFDRTKTIINKYIQNDVSRYPIKII